MKKVLFFSTALLLSSALWAQKGNQQKSRDAVLGTGSTTEQPTTTKKGGSEESRAESGKGHSTVLGGTTGKQSGSKQKGNGGGAGKVSKNQPAKVREAFVRDYPNATGVSWSKYQGNWTASFTSGVTRSTAVYHANGERRDTRTPVAQSQVPRPILEGIMKRRPGSRIGDIIRIEAPQLAGNIFRVKTTQNGTTNYLFYNAEGKQVSYDY
jgi:hypothetical protein